MRPLLLRLKRKPVLGETVRFSGRAIGTVHTFQKVGKLWRIWLWP